MQRMHALDPVLCAVDVQAPMLEIDLSPAKRAEFLGAQPMPICKQDRSAVPDAVAPTLTRCVDQSFDFCVLLDTPAACTRIGQSARQCSVCCHRPLINSLLIASLSRSWRSASVRNSGSLRTVSAAW